MKTNQNPASAIPKSVPAIVVRKSFEGFVLALDAIWDMTKDFPRSGTREVLHQAFSDVKNRSDFPPYHKKLFDNLEKELLDVWDSFEPPKK